MPFLTEPPLWFVHGLLAVTQTLVGFGAILNKIAFTATVNPVVFVLYRNLMAFPLTMAISMHLEATPKKANNESSRGAEDPSLVDNLLAPTSKRADVQLPFPIKFEHMPLLFLASLGMCMSNTLYAIGLKLGDPVLGSAWQASIPLWVMGYATMLGWEKSTKLKVFGFLLAIGGACVVLFVEGEWNPSTNSTASISDSNDNIESSDTDDSTSSSNNALYANVLFLLNVNGLAMYFLVCRYMTVTHGYSALGVSSWAFLINSFMILILAIIVAAIPQFHAIVMPDSDSNGFVIEWGMPAKTFAVLVYIVFVFSIMAFALSNWCQQFVEPAKVQIYQVGDGGINRCRNAGKRLLKCE